MKTITFSYFYKKITNYNSIIDLLHERYNIFWTIEERRRYSHLCTKVAYTKTWRFIYETRLQNMMQNTMEIPYNLTNKPRLNSIIINLNVFLNDCLFWHNVAKKYSYISYYPYDRIAYTFSKFFELNLSWSTITERNRKIIWNKI